MLELTIKANSLAELHSKILESANAIEGEIKTPSQPMTATEVINTSLQMLAPVNTASQPKAVPEAAKPTRAPRRTKAEIAAGITKAAPVVEVVQPVMQMPPMPTTETRVELPAQPQEVVSQPVQVETSRAIDTSMGSGNVGNGLSTNQPSTQLQGSAGNTQNINAYTFEVFKAQYLHILTQLSTDSKINAEWLESTKTAFGGTPVHEWGKNEAALKSLFTSFIEWGFIQELKV